MIFRRALLLLEPAADAGPALSALRRVAPTLEHLLVLVQAPASSPGWFDAEVSPTTEEEAASALGPLRESSAGAAKQVEVQLVPALDGDALATLCEAEQIELLALGSRSLRALPMLYTLRKRQPVALLWSSETVSAAPLREVGCVALGQRARAAIGAFLRDHSTASLRVTLLSDVRPPPEAVASFREVAGIPSPVASTEVVSWSSMRSWFQGSSADRPFDLLVLARLPLSVFLDVRWPAPALLLPPLSSSRPFARRSLEVADLVDDGGPLRVRLEEEAAVGSPGALPDQSLAFVSGGRVVATLGAVDGEAELPAGLRATSLGVYRMGGEGPSNPVAAIEQMVDVLRPGERPVALLDAELPDEVLRALAASSGPAEPEQLAVRLRPTRSFTAIRERLRAAGLAPRVVDARAVLDEGSALDVSEEVDPVRLARVASRMRRAGFPVVSILHRGPIHPWTEGFVALCAPDLWDAGGVRRGDGLHGPPVMAMSLASAESIGGNRIELEHDNARARGWLLEAIRGSARTLHLQVYMALGDDVGTLVGDALAEAGARGVAVRVLVDSLHGLHGSFGATNPLLDRLSRSPGVELRTSRPLHEMPSLTDLKRRDHRKLVVADGQVALVGGRNLSHEYYTGFGEVPLTEASSWREVPWLDAGARVEGTAVGALAASFREAWTEAGGAPFGITAPAPAGDSRARVIVHRGLRDARTLEAYLELIASARSHLYLVNGFPLALELQHALLGALRRGVRVRVLSGHVTPTHGDQAFSGPWSAARTVATELVHSRLDPLVEAGADVRYFAVKGRPGWSPTIGVVHPHVHAKSVSVDGLRCTVGSANLDITASYWESELVLLTEDAALTRAYEASLDALMEASTRVQKEDPAWHQRALRRGWMRHWPGVLSV
ncbi:MAG: phosphatidylserine/phosphatidylglycerophosphate/cardiolipin synthase family protein [Myxococcaceae bacterium]|nr:MAG: phosphatidylserine/phosphatidylglycerophosphate/cardiolipin synthase family protein [Myxococcaceae bacterium]